MATTAQTPQPTYWTIWIVSCCVAYIQNNALIYNYHGSGDKYSTNGTWSILITVNKEENTVGDFRHYHNIGAEGDFITITNTKHLNTCSQSGHGHPPPCTIILHYNITTVYQWPPNTSPPSTIPNVFLRASSLRTNTTFKIAVTNARNVTAKKTEYVLK